MIGLKFSKATEAEAEWIVRDFHPNCAWELSWRDRRKLETAKSDLGGLFLGIELLAYGIGWSPAQVGPCRFAPVFFDSLRNPTRCKLFAKLSEKEVAEPVLEKAAKIWIALGGSSFEVTVGENIPHALLSDALLGGDFMILEGRSFDVGACEKIEGFG